ncbi:GIY-YIG nuclease family protein [Vibrio salinus]|uniref:GIY-YIG nuclease family protein n=1 Tax=Vibrio salinus TaxID=2899784 RepID=UPI001E3DB8E1|nr:GIY-YIG nuclease family protein [Vibrio salinus]MCE0495934.1 GIY-YIG nuclease family protein [Vibrio salinus]
MANFGKSMRIFFADGSPTGLRQVEVGNWSGLALACPRVRFSEISDWPESQRPGVYFLLEKPSGEEGNQVYIGESENVLKRLASHDRDRDFWNEVIIFTSKDENLTKAHIKYLEARLIELTQSADRYTLENGNNATKSSLPRADMSDMEGYIDFIKLVLGSLGHKLLEPVAKAVVDTHTEAESVAQYELSFEVSKMMAKGRMVDEGFLLLKGSQVVAKSSQSMPGKVQHFKEAWIENGTLKSNGNGYVLAQDKLLSSSSYAASFVAGSSRSGPQSWKTSAGESLKELESRLLGQV